MQKTLHRCKILIRLVSLWLYEFASSWTRVRGLFQNNGSELNLIGRSFKNTDLHFLEELNNFWEMESSKFELKSEKDIKRFEKEF